MEVQQFYYDNKIVKKFIIATMFWGIIGMSVGLLLAFMFLFPNLTEGISWLSFGRLRPLHTNAVIFAFVGNAIFAGVYYSTQRLLKARMFSDALSNINFWGWQLIIVGAAITLPLGYTTSKEYAELEWPFDIAIAVIWVSFGINLIGTMLRRRQRHLYVAIWFYLATFVTVAVLHIFNNIELPVSALKSYSVYAGVQDALVQWWYGHNAVAFFSYHAFPGLDVLLCSESCQQAGLLLSPVYRAFLVAHFYLYLGRASPLALYRFTRLGTKSWCRIFGDVVVPILGRNDQWFTDLTRGLGQGSRGPGTQVHGGRYYWLRNGHF